MDTEGTQVEVQETKPVKPGRVCEACGKDMTGKQAASKFGKKVICLPCGRRGHIFNSQGVATTVIAHYYNKKGK